MAATKQISLKKFLSITKLGEFASHFNKLITTDTYSGALVGVANLKDGRLIVKITPYFIHDIEELGATKGYTDENDAEIAILQALYRDFVTNGVTPCIVKLESNCVIPNLKTFTNGENCMQLSRAWRKGRMTIPDIIRTGVCGWALTVDSKLRKNKIAVTVLETCEMSLAELFDGYLDTPAEFIQFKSIMFMIIYTLYKIQQKYPKFRHNDLHTNNIMIQLDPSFKWHHDKPRFLVFVDNGTTYTIPYFGYVPKIIDFGFAEIPEIGVRSLMTLHHIVAKERHGNDLLTLFQSIYEHSRAATFYQVISFMSRIDTEAIYEYPTAVGRIRVNEFPTLSDIMARSMWNEYRGAKIAPDMVYAAYLGDSS